MLPVICFYKKGPTFLFRDKKILGDVVLRKSLKGNSVMSILLEEWGKGKSGGGQGKIGAKVEVNTIHYLNLLADSWVLSKGVLDREPNFCGKLFSFSDI